MATMSGRTMTINVPARPSTEPEVSYQIWAECSGCGWKEWVDLAITNVRVDYEPPRPPAMSIDAMIDRLPAEMFRSHRCEAL
jgi:hypothetical protein